MTDISTPPGAAAEPALGVANQASTANSLGPLRDLPGYWHGTGLSIIARPDYNPANEDGFFLQLNWLYETLECTTIGAPIVNRGSRQDDISLYGVTYIWRVTDAYTGSALHIEPGCLLHTPETSVPAAEATVVRLSTIPHGNSLTAVGEFQEIDPTGPPDLPPVNTIPFPMGSEPPPAGTKNPYKAYDLAQECAYRTSPLPPEITQRLIEDPMNVVRDGMAGKMITHVTRMFTDTRRGGGVVNIPFVSENANSVDCESEIAVEHVQGPEGEYLQMQYHQIALLDYDGMRYPHVTVGTLVKSF
jgi:hypothetical protein